MTIENRLAKRLLCELESQVDPLSSGGKSSVFEKATIVDISEQGLKLRTRKFISVRRKMVVRLLVLSQKPIEVNVEAIWWRELPKVKQYEIGLRIITLRDRARIQDLLRSLG